MQGQISAWVIVTELKTLQMEGVKQKQNQKQLHDEGPFNAPWHMSNTKIMSHTSNVMMINRFRVKTHPVLGMVCAVDWQVVGYRAAEAP